MVTATCKACGTEHRVPDTLVPPSGKIMRCTSCSKPITVMPAGAGAMGMRGSADGGVPPKSTAAGLGLGRKPGLEGGPSLSAFDSDSDSDSADSAGDDVADSLELDDSFLGGGALDGIAAPQRKSPLAGIASASGQPVPKTGLTASVPSPPLSGGAGDVFDLGDPLDSNLPAPVGETARGIADLPAPVGAAGHGITDLPKPVGPVGGAARGITDLLKPVGPVGGAARGITDLPAPVGAAGHGITDLPKPVGPVGGAADHGITDLLKPVGPVGGAADHGITDLLKPVGPVGGAARGITGLPKPVGPVGDDRSRGIADLPAPVGQASQNLPAPKGFFDDLPADRGATSPGPGGRSTAAGMGGSRAPGVPDLPAPKGFFDDIKPPGMTSSGIGSSRAPGVPDLPAPKGFFDDIKPAAAAPSIGTADTAMGFFSDENDEPAASASGDAPVGATSGALDLDDLDLAPPSSGSPPPLDLGGSPATDSHNSGAPAPLDLDSDLNNASDNASDNAPDNAGGPAPLDLSGNFDLGGSAPAHLDLGSGGAADFGGMDLPSASTPALDLSASDSPPVSHSDDLLALDEDVRDNIRARTNASTTIDEAREAAAKKQGRGGAEKDKAKFSFGRKQIAIAAILVMIAGLGAGGYLYLSNRKASRAKADQVATIATSAHRFLSSDKPEHWDAALAEAEKALATSPKSSIGLGLAAQAIFAGYIDEGTRQQERRVAARTYIARINDASASGDEVTKAEALRAIFDNEPKLATTELAKVIRKNPQDGDAQLYLGWAYAALRDHKNAVAAFNRAARLTPNRMPVLYGLGQEYLALGKDDEARKAFASVRKRDEQYKDLPGHVDHLGALVGSYQLAEVRRFADRENLFLEITNHPQRDKADPRAVSLAWSLAGDQALLAGRVDESERRYEKAATLDPNNLGAKVGAARASALRGHLDIARAGLEKALAIEPGNLDATLALAEVATQQDQLEEAQQLVTAILERKPPLENKYVLARAHMVQGEIYKRSASGLDAAIEEYRAASKLVPFEDDIQPTVELAKALAHHPDKDVAAEAATLLEPITDRAKGDPALAVTLGLAYRSAGDMVKSERWFRAALEARPNDVEALYQLGLVLFDRGDFTGAIDSLKRAFDEGRREDIGRQLALFYERRLLLDDAQAIYLQLLDVKTPSLLVLARAGRFFARRGDVERTRQLGDKIAEIEPNNPAALFLRGEALLGSGKYADAVRFFRDATKVSPEPQFNDGLGRALLHLSPPRMDEAILAFKQATADKAYVSPRIGIVCGRLMRRDYRANVKKVTDSINEALALSPKDPFLYYATAEVFHNTGSLRKAVKAYKMALSLRIVQPGVRAFVEFRMGVALKDLDGRGEAARALSLATAGYEKLARAGTDGGDWKMCPMRFVSRWAATPPRSDEPGWIAEAYRSLGYVERARGNRGGAVRAWQKYLARDPADRDEAADVKRLLMSLKGH